MQLVSLTLDNLLKQPKNLSPHILQAEFDPPNCSSDFKSVISGSHSTIIFDDKSTLVQATVGVVRQQAITRSKIE